MGGKPNFIGRVVADATAKATEQYGRDIQRAAQRALPAWLKNGKAFEADHAVGTLYVVTIKHEMGRQPLGAFPLTIEASAPIGWAVTASDESSISLVTNDTASISWWVY